MLVCLFIFFCIVVRDSIVKSGEGWDPVHVFNPAPSLCMSQSRSWISDAISLFVLGCLGRAVVVHFIDINDWNVEHHSLNFILIICQLKVFLYGMSRLSCARVLRYMNFFYSSKRVDNNILNEVTLRGVRRYQRGKQNP